MPTVRIKDTLGGDQNERHKLLFKTLGEAGIFLQKIRDGRGYFYAITSDEGVHQITKVDCKTLLANHGFEVHDPLELRAMKSINAKQLDKQIDDYSREEIKANLERSNQWMKVEDVFIFKTTAKIMRITFAEPQMVQTALTRGLILLNQSLPPQYLEKEVFVKLSYCYNCLQYDHIQKNCTAGDQTKYTICASDNHRMRDCTVSDPSQHRCYSCMENHKFTEGRCPLRKKLIKDYGITERKRNRSISRKRDTTYASMAASYPSQGANMPPTQQQQQFVQQMASTIPTNFFAAIASAITRALISETMNPG